MSDTTSVRKDLFQRISEAFEAARGLEASARDAYLVELARTQPEVADEVRSLLGHDAAANSPVDRPVIGVARGAIVDRYRIVRPIGDGGMGTVYLAEQMAPVRREVALKLIKLGADSAAVLRRFEAERQALARMEHPGIARIYDGGVAADGRPFFAMELVRGEPITSWCRTHGLNERARLQLFMDICAAVQHAHQKGVIHRDLKPSNLLVSEVDGRPVPKIIDFGIAQALDDGSEAPMEGEDLIAPRPKRPLTIYGFGTPEYMSPEQAGQTPGDAGVDIRSDIYSLGVVLHELLTGSTQVMDLAAHSDLEWIVRRATARAPEGRYQSIAALADDVQRHLQHEMVSAHPVGMRYATGKFIRRHKVSMGVVAVVAIALIVGLTLAVWGLGRARDELFTNGVERGRLAGANGDLPEARELLWRSYFERPDSLQAAWALRELMMRHPCVWTIGRTGMRSGAIEAVDEATVVIAGRGIPPTILDVNTGATVAQCQPLDPQELADLAATQRASLEPVGAQHMDVSPDRSLLLVSDSDRPVSLWSLKELKELRPVASHGAGISAGVFLNAGMDIATAGHDGRVLITRTDGGSDARLLWDGNVPVRTLAASPDRSMLAAGLSDGRVCLWRNLNAPPTFISAHTGIVFALTFDKSGTLLATGSPDQFAAIWRVNDGSLVQRVASESGTVRDLTFDDQGALYILGWWRVARLSPGTERPTTVVSEGGWHFAMPRDGEMIVVSNNDDSIRRWRMNGSLSPVAMEQGWMVRRCIGGASPLLTLRGREISARHMDGTAAWTASLPAEITAFTASANGSCVAAGLADKSIWIRQDSTGFRRLTGSFESGLQHVLALNGQGTQVAFRIAGDGVGLIDLKNESAGIREVLPPSEQEQMFVRFSSDGTRLLEGGRGGTIRSVDLSSGQTSSMEANVTVFVVEALRNGNALLGAWTGPILIVDPQQRVVQILRGHSALVRSVMQHPTDPDLLLSGSMDGTVRLWHLGLGREFQSITPFGRTPLRTAGFDADGTHIIAASEDGRVCTWPLLLGDEYIKGNIESQREDLKGSFPSSQAVPLDQRHPQRRPG